MIDTCVPGKVIRQNNSKNLSICHSFYDGTVYIVMGLGVDFFQEKLITDSFIFFAFSLILLSSDHSLKRFAAFCSALLSRSLDECSMVVSSTSLMVRAGPGILRSLM